jgi:hypothetical protein
MVECGFCTSTTPECASERSQGGRTFAVSCAAGGRGKGTTLQHTPAASKLRGGARWNARTVGAPERCGRNALNHPRQQPVAVCRVKRAQVEAAPAASACTAVLDGVADKRHRTGVIGMIERAYPACTFLVNYRDTASEMSSTMCICVFHTSEE